MSPRLTSAICISISLFCGISASILALWIAPLAAIPLWRRSIVYLSGFLVALAAGAVSPRWSEDAGGMNDGHVMQHMGAGLTSMWISAACTALLQVVSLEQVQRSILMSAGMSVLAGWVGYWFVVCCVASVIFPFGYRIDMESRWRPNTPPVAHLPPRRTVRIVDGSPLQKVITTSVTVAVVTINYLIQIPLLSYTRR